MHMCGILHNIFEKMCEKPIMFYGFDLTEYLASLMTQNNFLLYWHLHYNCMIYEGLTINKHNV